MNIDSLYKKIAYDIDLAAEGISGSASHLADARDEVVNLTTSNNDSALKIELALLDVINNAYISYNEITQSVSNLLTVVRVLNNYVNNNYDGTLTAYVNGLEWDNDPNEKIPYHWARLSEQAGFDTSNWDAEMS